MEVKFYEKSDIDKIEIITINLVTTIEHDKDETLKRTIYNPLE